MSFQTWGGVVRCREQLTPGFDVQRFQRFQPINRAVAKTLNGVALFGGCTEQPMVSNRWPFHLGRTSTTTDRPATR